MAGDDEARARATLLDMQTRIAQGPHIVLGVAELATAEQVRAAFLELTKQFHPARFGRMSAEVQRISNEVFLGIKAAHDTMLRSLGAPLRPNRKPGSGGFAPITAEGSAGMRVANPRAPAVQPGPAPSSVRTTGAMPPVRPTAATPATAQPQAGSSPPTSPRLVSRPQPQQPPARGSTPALGTPILRPPPGPSGPSTARLGSPPQVRAPSPPRPGVPRPSDGIDPATLRYAGLQGTPATPAAQGPGVFDEQRALDQALGMLQARDWANARLALHALAARVPQSKPYRALLCYARGREAQGAGKLDDAALEFQRALQLDPDLAYAKIALAEVQRRR